MQVIHIIGYLGDDPEMKYTKDGQAVTNFSVAVNDPRDKEDETATATWYRVATWGASAEAANEFLKKGHRVAVVGTLRIRSYIDKDEFEAWSNDVNASTVEYLTPKDSTEAGERRPARAEGAARRPAAGSENGSDGDAGGSEGEKAPTAGGRRRTAPKAP